MTAPGASLLIAGSPRPGGRRLGVEAGPRSPASTT